MSCPDWKRLARLREATENPFAREAAPGSASEQEWQGALAHLDSGCQRCRREALAADPLLVFRRLPAPEMPEEREASEIDSMRRAVMAMRTASRLESAPRTVLNWRRWAAAAVLAILSLSVGPWRVPGDRPDPAPTFAPRQAAAPAVDFEGGNTIEAVENRPDARVYQMDAGGMSVAMVFDESFDV